MQVKACWILTVLAALALTLTTTRADSIWQRANAAAKSPASDDTARRMGDTLTIVVNERSVINNNAERNMEKKSDRSLSASGKFSLGIFGQSAGNLLNADVASSGDTKFDGTAKYQNDRQVTDSVTVTIEDVLPNGNLVVVGSRQRDIAGDKETIQISGIVRPSDIDFANTVGSERVANFRVVYKYKGQDSSFTKPNWLDVILNVVSPF
jgi:flagellar L-ring protein precursor FlgH